MTERDIFLAALDLPDPAARAAYLDGACGGDAGLRGRVEALLRSHNAAGSFLAAPAVAPAGATAAFATDPDGTSIRTDGGTTGPDADEALGFLAPPRRPESLGRIGHYEVLEVLGRGGFGIVFRAFDDVLQRVVAVKVLAPAMAATSPARKRFLREARSSAAVRHDNVVQVHAVEEQPLPYLVMEFIPGETLQQGLDRTGPLDVPEVLRIGRQVADGLAAAHATGLIHRDIKPANVLIDSGPRQQVKITDFGLARAADDASLTKSGVVAGTPLYMAPEQAKGEALDHRADLFSLGSVLYVMCTGRPPFRASTTLAVLKRVAEDEPRPIREVIPEVPAWLCRVVEKLHAKDPAGRFQTAREVADVLADCEAQLKAYGALRDFSRIPGGKPARPRFRRAVVIAGVLAIILLCGAVWATPYAQRYAGNRGEVEITSEPGWVSVIVHKDGTAVTDWFDVKTAPTIALPPGRYKLEPMFAPGRTIDRWEITTNSLFSGHGTWQGARAPEFEVARGERVTVRAVMRDEARFPAPPGTTPDFGSRPDSALSFQFEPGTYSKKVREFGVVVNVAGAVRVNPTRKAIKPGEKITTSFAPGNYTLDVSEPGELELSRTLIALAPGGHETVTLRPRAGDKPAPPAFAVLAKDAKAERMFATLADAAAAAGPGGTIEVRGDGPFVTPTVVVNRPLTIRAGKGFRPVLKRDRLDEAKPALIAAESPLVLEGLELQDLDSNPQLGRRRKLVTSAGAPLLAANCRFVSTWATNVAVGSPRVELRNCEFLCSWDMAAALGWADPPAKGTLRVQNCVTPNWGLFLAPSQKDLADVDIEFVGNTFAQYLLLSCYSGGELWNEGKAPRPFRVRAANNVLRTQHLFRVEINPSRTDVTAWPLDRVDRFAGMLFDWRGDRNVYLPTGGYELWHYSGAEKRLVRNSRPRADWKRQWGGGDTNAVEGDAVFQGGFLRQRAAAAPHQLIAEDFRLAPGSPGKGAGPGGKDLGADVDLVGPGAAYEKWRRTKDYEDWRKTIEPPPGRPAGG